MFGTQIARRRQFSFDFDIIEAIILILATACTAFAHGGTALAQGECLHPLATYVLFSVTDFWSMTK